MIRETTMLQLERDRRDLKVEIGSLVEGILNLMCKEDQGGVSFRGFAPVHK
jgi:hypothetical protein